MLKPTVVIWMDGHLVLMSSLHCKKKQTYMKGNSQCAAPRKTLEMQCGIW